MAAFTAAIVVALVPLALANHCLYGSVFANGYERTVVARSDGIVEIVHHTAMFNGPMVLGTLRVLFAPPKGLLLTNPVVVLAFVGAALLRRGNRRGSEYLSIGAVCIGQLLFFGRYDEWASSSHSNRFLMTPIALSSVFAATFLSWARDRRARAIDQ